jgi:hypothetical protein
MEQETGLDYKCTLLVVDQNPTVLMFVADVLPAKFGVVTASSRGQGPSTIECGHRPLY